MGWCIVAKITANQRCIMKYWDIVSFDNYNNYYKT